MKETRRASIFSCDLKNLKNNPEMKIDTIKIQYQKYIWHVFKLLNHFFFCSSINGSTNIR